MALVKAGIVDDLHESSLDSSAGGGQYMNLMKDVDTFPDDKSLLAPQWSGPHEASSENFKELRSSVTYKLISMPGDEAITKMANSPTHDTTFYVISNPGEIFGTHSKVSPIIKKNSKQSKAAQTAQSKAMNTAKKRSAERRATHNEVERRRRDKINNWIMKLAALVPNSGMPDSASKGGILAKACDHITDLTEKQKRLEKLELDNEKLVLEVLRLNEELSEVRKENSSMRNQMADNCIVYPRNRGQNS